MEINVREGDDFAIVRISGKVVRENQSELRSRLEEIIRPGIKGVALDFEKVEYLDSAGLGCCAAVHKLMDEKDCGVLVMFGASPNIEKMWKLIHLDRVIPLFPTEAEAVARIEENTAD